MRLSISRDQAKGLLGGVKFELQAKTQLTPEEAEIVKRYKADKEVLLNKEIKIPFTGRSMKFDLKIEDLVRGQTFKCTDVTDIIETEKNVKEACENFKNYLHVMKDFGGEEIIEYT